MITIEIDPKFEKKIQGLAELIESSIQITIDHCKFTEPWDCSVIITDNETIQQYNASYRQMDKPTDILSFETHEIDPETGILYLGDIIISYPQMEAQALSDPHPVSKELELLCVHGALHLLGHDHLEEDDKKEMWQKQEQILEKMNNSLRPK